MNTTPFGLFYARTTKTFDILYSKIYKMFGSFHFDKIYDKTSCTVTRNLQRLIIINKFRK